MGVIANIGLKVYTPKLGEKKSIAEMEARLSYGGGYLIDTPLQLKGQGINFIETYTAESFTNGAKNRRVGWNKYKVTQRAFDKLKIQYAISMESLLD